MEIPVVGEMPKTLGKISAIEIVEGKFGPQIQVTVEPVNPEATNVRLFWFPAPRPGQKPLSTSKWMKFVNSFNDAHKKAVTGAQPIKKADEMLDCYVTIEEIQRSARIQGEDRTWAEPTVVTIFNSATQALDEWRKDNPVVEGSQESSQENAENSAAPVAVKREIPEQVIGILKAQWASAGGDKEKFWAIVGPWGYDINDVFEAMEVPVPF